MFFQEVAPPLESTNYMIAGFVVIFSVMLFYVFSLKNRFDKLQEDLSYLEEADE